jgi:hypothetical protein
MMYDPKRRALSIAYAVRREYQETGKEFRLDDLHDEVARRLLRAGLKEDVFYFGVAQTIAATGKRATVQARNSVGRGEFFGNLDLDGEITTGVGKRKALRAATWADLLAAQQFRHSNRANVISRCAADDAAMEKLRLYMQHGETLEDAIAAYRLRNQQKRGEKS